jgi:hypothetical protein
MYLENFASRKFDVKKSEARTLSNILDPDWSRTQKFDFADSVESKESYCAGPMVAGIGLPSALAYSVS